MFGYIRPYDPYLYKKDEVLFNSLYCGICKSLGGVCGQTARLSLTYDIAFLSAFCHNVMGVDVDLKKSHCILHPIKKRMIAKRDKISDDLAYVNIILTRHKLLDDKFDSKKGGLKRLAFYRSYKKAKAKLMAIDEIVKNRYSNLRRLESLDNGLIDPLSDEFGFMLAQISDEILQDFKTKESYNLFFYLGKWIYLIDAIDDYENDKKKGEFNPFITRYKSKSIDKILTENTSDFDFMFADIFSNIKSNFYNIKFRFNRDLLENILIRGLPAKTAAVINQKLGNNRCKG